MSDRPIQTRERVSPLGAAAVVLLALALVLLTSLAAIPAAGEEEPETWRTVGTLVAYDPASQTLALAGQPAARVYAVRRSGPLATRISWNARPATLEQIPPGASVELRWRRDPSGRPVVRFIEGPRPADPEPSGSH